MDFSEIISKRVVYALPGMEQSRVRPNIAYKTAGGADLCLDAYYPPGFTFKSTLPAVLFIHGDGPADLIKDVKDWGQYISWGQLAAASGFIGIPFNHRSSGGEPAGREAVASDVHDLITFVRAHASDLNLDPDRLCVMACSAGVAYLWEMLASSPTFVRCLVAYYGSMDFGQVLDAASPLFIVQAGLDDPGANATIDRFYSQARSLGAKVELVRHPSGHHGFDVLDDDNTSRKIIRRNLIFYEDSSSMLTKNLAKVLNLLGSF